MEIAYPDTLVGTDSHTTMVNGLAVLGWGVGGIEAEAAMLGQPYSMLLPEVIGVKLTGKLKEGVTATDLVLTVTQMLRKRGVVGKFVEFFGPGLAEPDDRGPRHHRQHGAGIRRDLRLLPDRRRHHRLSARHRPRRPSASRWSRPMPRRRACTAPSRRPIRSSPTCSSSSSSQVEPSLAGPKRPQDRVALKEVKVELHHGDGEGVQQGRRRRQGRLRSASLARHLARQELRQGRRPQARAGRGPQPRSRPRRRGDRRDHLLHQHLEPERDDRRRACSPARRWPRA